MLLIGPSQTGKTTWIYKFISNFDHINPGHKLKKVLFLHMTVKENALLNKEDSEKVVHHRISNSNMQDDENIDEEIIDVVEKFKSKETTTDE